MNEMQIDRIREIAEKAEREAPWGDCRLHPDSVLALLDRLSAAEAEALEQARLNGIGAERELALMARVAELERERAGWKAKHDSNVKALQEACHRDGLALAAAQDRIAALEAELSESVTENLWSAYHAGFERDGEWWAGGMSDAEWLAREVDLDPGGRHPAQIVKDLIPDAGKARAQALAARVLKG